MIFTQDSNKQIYNTALLFVWVYHTVVPGTLANLLSLATSADRTQTGFQRYPGRIFLKKHLTRQFAPKASIRTDLGVRQKTPSIF